MPTSSSSPAASPISVYTMSRAVISGSWADAGIKTVRRIGDCLVPSSIADAVHGAHRAARELEAPEANRPLRRERPVALPVAGET